MSQHSKTTKGLEGLNKDDQHKLKHVQSTTDMLSEAVKAFKKDAKKVLIQNIPPVSVTTDIEKAGAKSTSSYVNLEGAEWKEAAKKQNEERTLEQELLSRSIDLQNAIKALKRSAEKILIRNTPPKFVDAELRHEAEFSYVDFKVYHAYIDSSHEFTRKIKLSKYISKNISEIKEAGNAWEKAAEKRENELVKILKALPDQTLDTPEQQEKKGEKKKSEVINKEKITTYDRGRAGKR